MQRNASKITDICIIADPDEPIFYLEALRTLVQYDLTEKQFNRLLDGRWVCVAPGEDVKLVP